MSCVCVLRRGRWWLSRVEDLEHPGIYPDGRIDSRTSTQHVPGCSSLARGADPEPGTGGCCPPGGVTGTGAGPPLLRGFQSASACHFIPAEPGTKHTLPPTTACCSFNMIDFIFFKYTYIYICVFKYISYLTLGISQAGAAHLAQVQSHMARRSPTRGSPHPLTHTHAGRNPHARRGHPLGEEHRGKRVWGTGVHPSLGVGLPPQRRASSLPTKTGQAAGALGGPA